MAALASAAAAAESAWISSGCISGRSAPFTRAKNVSTAMRLARAPPCMPPIPSQTTQMACCVEGFTSMP